MKDTVVLKGDRDGLFLVVNSERPFSDILLALEEKLKTSSEFFTKTPEPPLVRYKGERCLTRGEGGQLCELLDRYGIVYDADFSRGAQPAGQTGGEEKGGRAECNVNEMAYFLSPLVFEMEMMAKDNEAEQPACPPQEDGRESGTDGLPAAPADDGRAGPCAAEELWLWKDQGAWVELPEQPPANDEGASGEETGGPRAPAGQAAEAVPLPGEGNRARADADEGDMMAKSMLFEDGSARQTPAAETASAAASAVPEEPDEEPVGDIVLSERQHDNIVNYESADRPALTIYRTVRGGQEIRYDGSVIVFGDINPTARIFAKNDIIVAGVTRGILYAGCRGDRSASIAAGSFSGGQIRIADLIVRAPDEPAGAVGFGVARIYNNQIEIRTIRR